MDRKYVSAIPAYGRDYPPGEEGEAAVREDWAAHKDFLIQDLFFHGYVNDLDLPPYTQLNIRYNKLEDICVIEAIDADHEAAKAQFDERDYDDSPPHFLDMEDGPTLLDDEHTIVDDYMR
jgi:hypothetical protein